MAKYRKAHKDQDPFILIKNFPSDVPEDGEVLWMKIQRPSGKTFSQLTALRGLSKIDEKGNMVLAMNPIDALVQLLPEAIIEWNMIDIETNLPMEINLQNIYDLEPGDFQYLLDAWSRLINAFKAPKIVDPAAPRPQVTVDEKKGLAATLVIDSVLSEAGGMPKNLRLLEKPLADG